ncbi:unnamed protein product [Trichobilharzia szidati]|nr:unnamed protein product [Trichobilharzia szidati]
MFSFATREMICLYKKFPEVVGMDSTYNTNKEDHPLYQLVVTDGLNRSCPIMYSITLRERLVDFEAVLQSFKNIIGGTSQTVTFVTDKSAVEQRACSIVLCAFHVIRAFNNKFRDPQCKRIFKKMVCITNYDRLSNLIMLMRLQYPTAMSYISNNLWSCRNMWAACYMREVVTLGNKTNNRVECCHKHPKTHLSKCFPLELSIREIWKCSIESSRRKAGERNRNLHYFIKFDVDEGISNILRHLTNCAAYSLYKSIKRLPEMKVTGCTETFVVFEGDGNSVVDKHDCSCPCFQNSNMLLPCRHPVHTK